jgi:uncharacterized protein (DUF1697 family)
LKCVAFLRAINVGGHTVKMDHLRRLFEKEGFSNVETFIASGNVLFEARDGGAAERRIEKVLGAALGYEVATFVRAVGALPAIASLNPFDGAGGTLYIGFLPAEPAAAAKNKLMTLASDLESFHFAQRELYWCTRSSFRDSKIDGGVIEKTLGMKTTLRNINTVRRIAEKYAKA